MPTPRVHGWRPWLFLVVPIVGLLELLLHVSQVTYKVSDDDWARARDEVKKTAQPDDLVVFAPHWVDPVGREKFGADLATVQREARADDTRFARAIEVSIRGKHLDEFSDWPVVDTRDVGKITLTTRRNPSPVKVLDDLLDHMGPQRMRVSRVDGDSEQPCAFGRAASQTGNIGFGPGIPAERFSCSGSYVGITVLPDLDYVPHRCFFAPPLGQSSILRVRFADVKFGHWLRGHHAISVHAERDRTGAPVTLVMRVGDKRLGRFVHSDGDSWKAFEIDTSDLAGQSAELTVDITAPNSANRQYCFEASTR